MPLCPAMASWTLANAHLPHCSRYNLKRRVASLPPISAEAFTEKVLQARAQSTAEADKAFFERVCDACEKTYYSENSFQNHLLSQKHRAREAKGPQPAGVPDEASSVMSSTFSLGDPVHAKAGDDESLDMAVEEEFNQVIEGLQKTQVSHTRPSPVKRPSNPPPAHGNSSDKERDSNSATPTPPQPDPATLLQQCLFCRYQSPTVALNAHHMERFHGMVIPEKEFLVDLDGLVKHLSSKVYEGLQCLTCGKTKANAFAVQTHMRDVGHCTIPFTTEREQLDVGDFYDFRSTYSDGEEDEEEEEGESKEKKLGVKRSTKLTHENGEVAGGEDEGWETDSSASSFESEELTAVHADHPERSAKGHHHQPDGWHSHAHKGTRAVFFDDYELHLPSGKSVGHRSLNKYYRQNLQNYPTPEERAERLALENGEAGEDGEGEGEAGDGTVATRGQNKSRAVIPRGEEGVLGITDQKRQALRREMRKGRDVQKAAIERRDLRLGKSHNNQKNYYYRYDGGG